MNRYNATSIIRQTIISLLLFCTITLQTTLAQLRYKNTDEPSLPKKYTHLKKADTLSIQRMLKEGIPVDAIDERGRTLLMQKAFEGDTVCLEYLIKSGADVDKRHKSGNLDEYLYTALDYAILGEQNKTIDFLRRKGARWEEERQNFEDGEIKALPRMESFYNKVGKDREWLVILISALVPFLLIARLVRKYLKEEWQQDGSKLLFPIGMMWFAIGCAFHVPLSILYSNFDDFYTRLRGQEYIAEADYSSELIKVYNSKIGYEYEFVSRYTFTFVTENGVITCLNQGKSNFSEYRHLKRGDKLLIKYLPQTQKLSIADTSNTYDNLLAMSISGSFLWLMIALLMGKLNFLYKSWKKFRERKAHKRVNVDR